MTEPLHPPAPSLHHGTFHPLGHEAGEEHVEVYRESITEDAGASPTLCYTLPGKETANDMASLAGIPVLRPYPQLEPLQQKRLAARRHNTTYCYDFPALFENALRDMWSERAAVGEPASGPPSGRLVDASELVLAGSHDFRSDALRLERIDRGYGANDVGMVAWQITLKTPECPAGRGVIAVANDITHNSGAFGPAEDALFRAAGAEQGRRGGCHYRRMACLPPTRALFVAEQPLLQPFGHPLARAHSPRLHLRPVRLRHLRCCR